MSKVGEEWRDELQRLEPMFESRDQFKDTVFLNIAQLLGALSTCPRGAVGALIVRDGRCISWGFNGAPAGLPHCGENGHGWGTIERQEGKSDLKGLSKAAGEKLREYPRQDLLPWDWQGAVDKLAADYGCRNATHAEANALAYAARQGISTDGGTCYVECSPCRACARLLIAAGIVRVVFARAYRDQTGVNTLREAGVQIG